MILEKKQNLPKYKANISKDNLIMSDVSESITSSITESDIDSDLPETHNSSALKIIQPIKQKKNKKQQILVL
jgi:hypothetical protein